MMQNWKNKSSTSKGEARRLAELQKVRAISRRHFFEYQFESARGMLDQMRRFTDLEDKEILDLGCGLGGSSVYYASEGLKVTAVDNQAYDRKCLNDATAFARDKGVHINFCLADAHNLPFRACFFDIVRLDSVLEHLENPERAISECRRVLKDKGLLFVTFPLFYSPYGGHIIDYIKIPWFHVLPSSFVQRTIRLCKSKTGFITTEYVEKLFMSLNRMTLRRFKGLVQLNHFKEIFLEEAFYMPHDASLFFGQIKEAMSSRPFEFTKETLAHFNFVSVVVYIFLFLLYRLRLHSVRPFNELIVSGIRSVLMK